MNDPSNEVEVYGVTERDGEPEQRNSGRVESGGALSFVLFIICSPVPLVWDVVTFPVQLIRGDPPYGDGSGSSGSERSVYDQP